ncbi:M16 family metallopeptidase [Maricaulis parjimensis]|uniref:M16 family metallopeptidase n=1 Tax=Maricaulis parjimensis TaxID=144023 RepID=UPI00193A9A3C|nr:pitrilysin family protein [Maricaulis parjimensis]
MRTITGLVTGFGALLLVACQPADAPEETGTDTATTDTSAPALSTDFTVDVSYHQLDNGLRVVLSEDDSVPTATVAVYYGVGFRNEPQGRTGFAHLFEHLMFQGSRNLPHGAFDSLIYGSGGVNNGSTRYDFTNYFEVVPSNALEAVLWAEADRMAYPDLDEGQLDNQREVVRNEVFVNVINQPYGGWIWIDLPMAANENWHNSHNFYGDLTDLDAASLEDAQTFFDQFYAPNNAVIVVAGDIDREETLGWIETMFGHIEAGDPLPQIDVSEPRQTEEKFAVREDALANQPALAVGYHMPERGTPEYYAMILIDQLLLQGDDSRLTQSLVNEEGFASGVFGGINLLGNAFNYDGPMLWTVGLIHDSEFTVSDVMTTIDTTVEGIRSEPVSQADLERARTKLLSDFYDTVDTSTRFGLVDLLAAFALFDDDPERINRITEGFNQVTPELVMSTAQEYLRPTNRTVLEVRLPDEETGESDD